MAIDFDTAVPVKQNEFGATVKVQPVDLSTAKPVPEFRQRIDKTTGQPDERYVRPLTDTERAQATTELITRERGQQVPIGQKVSQALETPEARAVEEGALTLGFSPMLQAVRGITSAEVPERDVWNMVIDSAKKSILEPGTVEPTSVAVLKAYPKMDWKVAGVLGTAAEIGFTTDWLESAGKFGADALSRDTQATEFINRLRTTESWNRNVGKIAESKGIPVSEVDNQLARSIWDSRNDASYWSILKGNIKNSFMERSPFRLGGLSTEDVSGGLGELGPMAEGLPAAEERGEKIVQAAVKIGSKTFYGVTHEEALNKAGLSKKKEGGDAIEGKDFEAFLVDEKKNLYTREQSSLLYGVGQSSEIEKQGTPQAKSRMTKARQAIEEQQTAAKAQFVKGRINQLEGESGNLWDKIKLLGEERDKLEKGNMPVGKVVNEMEQSLKKVKRVDDEIQRLYLGNTMISDIKNEMLSLKAKDLMSEQDAIEEDALKQGTLEGKTAERERWQLKTEKEKKAQIEKEARQRERERVNRDIKRMTAQISRLPTDSLPLDYKDKIEEIKSNFDFKRRSDKTLSRREGMQDFVARQLAQGNEINIPTEKLDLVHRIPLSEMTYQDVKDVHEAVMRLYKNGKLKDRLLTQQKEVSFEKVVQQAVNVLTKGKGITPETTIVKALQKADKTWAEQSFQNVRWYILNYMRPELMYNALDGWTQGINTKTCWDALYHAENGEMVDSDLFHTVVGKNHEKLSLKDLHTKSDVGRFKNMTKSNAMFIYANSFNEGNLEHLYGSGLTDEDIKAVEQFLSPAEKEAVSSMIRFFDSYMYPRLSKVYERLEGVHLPKEENYWPIERLEDVSYDKELEKDLLERSYVRRPGVTKGFTKARVSSTKGFSEFDYFGTLYRHLDKVAHYLNYAEAVRDVNKFLLNPEIKAAMSKSFGEDYYDIMYKHLKDSAYGKLNNQREFISHAISFVRTRATPLYLGYNFLTTAKQLVGFVQGMEMAGKVSSLKALIDFTKHPLNNLKFVDDKSPMMKFRSMRQEREFQEMVANRSWEDKLKNVTGLQWIQEKGLWPTLFVDRIVANCIWRGAYGESIMKGMDEKAAIEEADRVTRRTQPMGGLMHLPHMFRGGEAQRLMTFLKGHTNKLFNLQIEMVGAKKDGKTSNGRFAAQLLFYTLLPATMMTLIEKKRLWESGKEVVGAIGRQATMSLWGVEDLFHALETGRYNSNFLLDEYAAMIGKLLTSKNIENQIDDALFLLSGYLGLPYVGVKRIIKGEIFGAPEKKKNTQKKESSLSRWAKQRKESEVRQRAREKVNKVWE